MRRSRRPARLQRALQQGRGGSTGRGTRSGRKQRDRSNPAGTKRLGVRLRVHRRARDSGSDALVLCRSIRSSHRHWLCRFHTCGEWRRTEAYTPRADDDAKYVRCCGAPRVHGGFAEQFAHERFAFVAARVRLPCLQWTGDSGWSPIHVMRGAQPVGIHLCAHSGVGPH